jgi:surface protein
MENAFYGCENLALLASDAPDLTKVSSLKQMFRGATNLTGTLNHWDTSTITSMNLLFYDARNFNQPLSSWNTANVVDMYGMFANTPGTSGAFNQPLVTNGDQWNVEKVIDFRYMFRDATSFDQDLSSWMPIAVVTKANFTDMLKGSNLSPYHYNAFLASRSQKPIITGATAVYALPAQYGGCGVSNAAEGIAGRATLVDSVANGGMAWALTDGGLSPECSRPFITTRRTTTPNETVQIPVSATLSYNFQIDWGETGANKNFQVYNGINPVVSHTYAQP